MKTMSSDLVAAAQNAAFIQVEEARLVPFITDFGDDLGDQSANAAVLAQSACHAQFWRWLMDQHEEEWEQWRTAYYEKVTEMMKS